MDDVNFVEFPFLVVVKADADPHDATDPRGAGNRWTGLVASTEALARPRPGYGGGIWLAQGQVLGPPPAPDTELLTGFFFWRSSSDAEAFAVELSRTQPGDEFVDDLVVDEGIYQFAASMTASPDNVTGLDPSSARSDPANEIIRLTPDSGRQGWVGEYNESETRDHTRHLDGFVSASFFRDLRSERIVEHVQWRSAADLTAAFDDARFAEHLSVNSHYSTGEAVLFGERLADDAV
ncbi:hypothetical protein OG218_15100 [Kineococcus sp. NBC_00420]|uniref:hypothetical protein n=1 Tax=Kineococcus sp. NBC_00420 TaxID=2903564 RepID=UPI002E1E8C16